MESTPFYLYSADARRRIAEDLPDAKLVAIIRDPVDRAYSNWMHLWVDGLEPAADFCDAWRAEDARVDAGWAPFWHYRRMGRYGEQLADLFSRVERDRVLVLRYRELVAEPARDPGPGGVVPRGRRPGRWRGAARQLATVRRTRPEGSRVGSGGARRCGRRALRAPRALAPGRQAALGPCSSADPNGDPSSHPRYGAELVKDCLDDIGLLEEVLGESFDDWRSTGPRVVPGTGRPELR